MEIVETRSLPSHLPPQPPRQIGLCCSNENKGASHHRLDWKHLQTAECCMQDTSWEPSHFTCAENGFWERSHLLVFHWLWAVNSRSSFLGSQTPPFSSTSNREKLPCFSKPMPPLPSNTDSLVARREGMKAVREENTLLSAREKTELPCVSTPPPKHYHWFENVSSSFYWIWFSLIPEYWLLTTTGSMQQGVTITQA